VTGTGAPFRGSLRAAALIGALERGLAPARELASVSLEDSELVRPDACLSPLVSCDDPFAALTAATARVAEAPTAVERAGDRESGLPRSFRAAADGLRSATHAPAASGAAHAQTARSRSPSRPASQVPHGASEPRAHSHARSVASSPGVGGQAVSRLLADSARALPRERVARPVSELSATVPVTSERRAAQSQKSASFSGKIESRQAHEIWQERLERVGLRSAFHSPIRRDAALSRITPESAAQRVSRAPAAPSALAAPRAPAVPSAYAGSGAFEAREAPAARQSMVRRSASASTPVAERGQGHPRTPPAVEDVRASGLRDAAGASGLRRLAGFASERLDEPESELLFESAPIARATAAPEFRPGSLAEELDGLLRAELLQSGIDARRLVR
jgi:hypothetical protein